jgi:peptidoglycan/LPS O-acetylase OafA/YrhL
LTDSSVSRQEPVLESAPRSLAPSFYRPELDALRFLAFLLVFCFHVLPSQASLLHVSHNALFVAIITSVLNSTTNGLCLFFVLSAYLIATLLLREVRFTGTVNLRAFYERRVLRIWPLYFFALALAFTVSSWVHGFPGIGIIAAYLCMAGNYTGVFHLHSSIGPLKIFPLWSISVEEQFYVFFPFMARSLRYRNLWALCIGILAVMVSSILYLCHRGVSNETLWYSSFVQFGMFAAGILLALLFSSRSLPTFSPGTRILGFLVACLLSLGGNVCLLWHGEMSNMNGMQAALGYLMIAAACSLMLVSVLGFSGTVPKPLIYLGKISYGLYVFHIWALSLSAYLIGAIAHVNMQKGEMPVKVILAKDSLGLMLSIAMAALSYRLLEKPFLRLKRKFEVIRTRPA